VRIRLLRHVNGCDGTLWGAGAVVDCPDPLARELIASKRAAAVPPADVLDAIDAEGADRIANHAADVTTRDPQPRKRKGAR
jgi:hypothetical protein